MASSAHCSGRYAAALRLCRRFPDEQKGRETMCEHQPPCPTAEATDREAALLVAHHPEQGWSLLCNGVLVFEDTGELLPNGEVVAPHRPTDTHKVAA
ncbi:hypothetical protein C9F11_43390 (plasmid) [Streptomyces sp. YIM 121038]|nr:hypothetical protein C9F11_43390 [Streptomyces sp. YIM 121038]